MFIFIDESGSTYAKSDQKFLVVAFALMNNHQFADELIFEIKRRCNAKGKAIKKKELKYHDLTPFQREIAVQTINSKYRNFYVCFFDVEKASKSLVDGQSEQVIQTLMIHNVLSKLDRNEMKKHDAVRVVMDKKLAVEFQKTIRKEFQVHIGTKKGIEVKTAVSSKERGVQVADLIAGAFRAKLMKKSDLFQVDHTQVFQITPHVAGESESEKSKM